MVEYYFDIETTGLDPKHDKIITIQIQRLVGQTAEPIEEIEILKEWQSSEKEIIEKVMPLLTCKYPFDFIMVGNNLLFDFVFLNERAKKYGLKGLDLAWIYDRAFKDLKHILVMINNGNFKGWSGLLKEGKFSNKEIPELYKKGRYEDIIEYVNEEAQIFVDAYQKLRREMPSMAKCF